MGTRKQKMMISKDNVEAIYSMDPPGRFLKKCSDTGQWKELPEREATNKAAQAMAYLVIVQKKHKKQHSHHPLHSSSSSNTLSVMPSHFADVQPIPPFQDSHHRARSIGSASLSSSSKVNHQWGEGWGEGTNADNAGGHSEINIQGDDELLPRNSILHRQLGEKMRQSSTSTSSDLNASSTSGDGTLKPQTTNNTARHQQRQRQLHRRHDFRMVQNELLPHTRLPPSSLKRTQSSLAPVHRAAMLRNLISTAIGSV